MSTTAFITLPFLALISIPLAISAYFTICFSALALFLRLSIIYIELCYAIIANYFVIPTSNTSSLLNFAPSEPTTPAAVTTPKRRSFDHGKTVYFSGSHYRQSLPISRSQSRPGRGLRRNSMQFEEPIDQDCVLPDDGDQNQREETRNDAFYPSLRGFLSLISGDERRDFEGVGGWRCWASSSRLYGHHSLSISSSSSGSVSEEADERAWLSINNRLELPSQPFPMRNSHEVPEHSQPWTHQQVIPGSSGDSRSPHHRRSATTSILSSLNARTSNLAPLPPPARTEPHTLGNRPSTVSLRSSSQQSVNGLVPAITGSPRSSSYAFSPSDPSGGYFISQPSSGTSSGTSSGATTPGKATAFEEMASPRAMNISMSQYLAGMKYRRRSMSGPNSGARVWRQ
ncbi:hypothetical protein BDV25DRAFT_77006 [Aspergillus avenaceus]|uniref:Uncharacterized protein n=1 Tax=Aspergillus avenaceus TaxID=36643 RepID=A0A5N6TG76_ASPAV|nr:hypothetical protein BDV25DRAFT_77006 [Aspergillus avenaceus]